MTRRINRRDAIAAMLAAAGAVSAPNVLRAQAAFPNRPIRIIVPVAPGGGVDTFARLIAAKVKIQRDVQFIVENRTGGNSTIGGLDVQRAAPDGYTVLFHASTHNVARLVLRMRPTIRSPISRRSRLPAMRRSFTSSPTTARRKRLPRSSPRPRPVPTSGRSRPRSSARPAISLLSRSISTTVSTCRSSSIAARRRPPTMSSAAMCR